jgi:hypothetical protein
MTARRTTLLIVLLLSLTLSACQPLALFGSIRWTARSVQETHNKRFTLEEVRGIRPQNLRPDLLSSGSLYELGFHPETDGFHFTNYDNNPEITNLTPIEIRRMFGDQACARFTPDEEPGCILIPAARQFMEEMNALMDHGHCEGLAVLSLFFYSGLLEPHNFGAAATADLVLEDNAPLQREIAYWFTTQVTTPTSDNVIRTDPNHILEILAAAFDQNVQETYTLGVYQEDMTAGHSLTPYALEWKGEARFWLWVYDNNFPGEEHYIAFDLGSNSWRYEVQPSGTKSPIIYSGDSTTNNLDLTPGSARLGLQECTFCEPTEENNPVAKNTALPWKNQLWIEGHIRVLIENDSGKRLGYLRDGFINEIPGSDITPLKFAQNPNFINPLYGLPIRMGYQASLQGAAAPGEQHPTRVVMIGQGFYIGIENLMLAPGQEDLLRVSEDGLSLTYQTSAGAQPEIIFGMDDDPMDYELRVAAAAMPPGSEITLTFQRDKGWLTLSTRSATENRLGVEITCIYKYGVETFLGEDIPLGAQDLVHFDITNWWRFGYGDMQVHIDESGDGTIDRTLEIENMQ